MLPDIEARLHCEKCDDTPYTIYRVPAKNEGVFVHEVEPLPPEGEARCPMCTGPLVRV
ncbi:MAG: hypothetical protein V3S55_06330 [Nitrospiraceae bacterium]